MQETDKDTFILNLRNGSLNLKTGELREHRRQDNSTKLVNIDFKPRTKCEHWIEYLEKVFQGDQELIEYIQKMIGYTLTGSISEQCFFMLYGKGSNGKSTTFLRTIEEITGDYAETLNGSSLMVRKNNDGARGDLAKLVGRRFISVSELNEGQTFDESLIKAITGGDPVPVRFLYGEEFPLRAQFKLWMATNEKPKIKGTNLGIWRRVRLIPFLYSFSEEEKDKNFFEKYLEPELSGILNWAIEGCLMWQKDGIKTSEKVLAAVDDYRSEMDQIQRFIDDSCLTGAKFTAKITDLYDTYVKWCTDTREHELSSIKFSKKLKEKGFEQVRTGFARHWSGIGIADGDRKEYGDNENNVWPFETEQISIDKE
jgi:putative DNA primase/helicase